MQYHCFLLMLFSIYSGCVTRGLPLRLVLREPDSLVKVPLTFHQSVVKNLGHACVSRIMKGSRRHCALAYFFWYEELRQPVRLGVI